MPRSKIIRVYAEIPLTSSPGAEQFYLFKALGARLISVHKISASKMTG
jgi:hypothetical protein